MNSAVIELLVLAGIAVFLILRLKNVLGSREGFEKPVVPVVAEGATAKRSRRDFEVIEGGPDADITDHAPEGSPAAKALAGMKATEPSFHVGDFLRGARGAYEMILVAFQNGHLDPVVPFLSRNVFDAFTDVIETREREGVRIEANFVGIRELTLENATFDEATKGAEVTVRFVAEQTSVARNADGKVVEGSPNEIQRQKDVWTFGRKMGSDDPNWQLVDTGA